MSVKCSRCGVVFQPHQTQLSIRPSKYPPVPVCPTCRGGGKKTAALRQHMRRKVERALGKGAGRA